MAVRILTEANRCLQCKKPMCQEGVRFTPRFLR